MGNQQVTDIELGWFVGIVEGEGYISINRVRTYKKTKRGYCFSPRFVIANTDTSVIAKCTEILKKMNIGYYVQENNPKAPRKTYWMIRIDRFAYLAKLLPILIPHLIGERKARAKLTLEFVESRISNGINGRGQASNTPYSDRDIEVAETLGSWNPNDYMLPVAEFKSMLRRDSLNSGRKPESVAEMTTPLAN